MSNSLKEQFLKGKSFKEYGFKLHKIFKVESQLYPNPHNTLRPEIR